MKDEKLIERQCLAYARAQGVFCFLIDSMGTYDPIRRCFRKNNNPFRLTGLPDAALIVDGTFVGIEFKAPKGRQSETQRDFQAALEAAQGKYFIVRSLEDMKRVLGDLRRVDCTSI